MDSLRLARTAAMTSDRGDELVLTIARGYLATLIGNVAVYKLLRQRYSDILDEFQLIIDAVSPDQKPSI